MRIGICLLTFLLVFCPKAWCFFSQERKALFVGSYNLPNNLDTNEIFLAPQGWLAFGVREKTTVIWDWAVAFGNIPAFGVRENFYSSESSMLSANLYFNHFPEDTKDERVKEFVVLHEGMTADLDLSYRFRIDSNLETGFYLGTSYFEKVSVKDLAKSEEGRNSTYEKKRFPKVGAYIGGYVNPLLRWQAAYMIGNTFVFFDQIPDKTLATISLLLSPFGLERAPYLRNLHFELSSIFIKITEANYEKFFPVFPIIYWQWTF